MRGFVAADAGTDRFNLLVFDPLFLSGLFARPAATLRRLERPAVTAYRIIAPEWESLTLRGEYAIKGLAFLPDGTSLVAACDDDLVRVWTGTPLGVTSKEDRYAVLGTDRDPRN